MKTKIFYLILFLTLCLNCFSQEKSEKKDTLVTRKGNKFIQPKSALVNDTVFNSDNDIEPRFLE